jgi:hypothetical protein
MAIIPTLLAVSIGLGLGLRWGGQVDNLTSWRPPLLYVLAGGVSLTILVDVLPLSGGFMTVLSLIAMGMLMAFAFVNIRTGGMVLILVGFGLNFVVTLLNWGTPVSTAALESAGIVSADETSRLVLDGGREVASGAFVGFLGDVIPLPWHQVISIGDLIVLVGLVLVTSSVVRRYEVGGRPPVASASYRKALDALGRGPAPRRGPGLHPSRLGSAGRRRRPGTGPR